MCGLTGFLDLAAQTEYDALQTTVKRMIKTLGHRGPDDQGIWVDAETGLGLGHRRLAIVDLSAEGHQPMHSADGRYIISFNGEIYNFKVLRHTLEKQGHTFRGHSDTEVMLAAIGQWGLEAAIERFVGMFTFALWDRYERRLHLVRDRLGIKPLYYGLLGRTFLFGSELKALSVHPAFTGEIDRNALTLYLRHTYIPTPYSIYKNICKLPPGTILTVSSTGSTIHTSSVSYWSPKEISQQGLAEPFAGSIDEAVTQLDTLLRDAVKLRMIADVPLGAFLSGGVDSSTVVALMQTQSERPVKTFTIGFHETDYNEAVDAKSVAQHLGTEHTELYVTSEQTLAVIPKLPTLYDEPFADSSQIPTYLVSKLTRRHVTVSLSGDGGDELFAGYRWYFRGQGAKNKLDRIPGPLRKAMSRSLTMLSPEAWESFFQTLAPLLPNKLKQKNLSGDKPYNLAEVLNVAHPELLYGWIISHWKRPAQVVLNAQEPPTALTDHSRWIDTPNFMQRMMYLDMVSYLPDDILTKIDRASMGVSLEARVPLLDHRVVEFAWRIPLSMKIKGGQNKWLLRQVLYKYVPKTLIDRPKQGFAVPIDTWLRGPLREWAETLLAERRLRQEEFFNPQPIRQKWIEHLSGKYNWERYLWDVLMFQAWLEH